VGKKKAEYFGFEANRKRKETFLKYIEEPKRPTWIP
jgi:hypothetical protein